ncbi:MAG: hypothetical protein ACT6RF_09205 [Allorhizobium sp.]|uniref:hypothetical protein n=1 Tax=Allorhizobium sp. TaxID=633478 RepID=UPI004033B487
MKSEAPCSVVLLKLATAISQMREIYPTMTLQTLQVYLEIAAQPGISSVEIRQKTGIAQPTVSRTLGDLGEWAIRRDEPGLDLVRTERDPTDQRNVLAYLTTKGKLLAHRLEQVTR